MQYHFMGNINLKTLKKKLPPKFASLIAGNLDGVSNRQVQCVFNGEITNPEMVEKIVDEARKLAAKMKRIQRKAGTVKRTRRRPITKPSI